MPLAVTFNGCDDAEADFQLLSNGLAGSELIPLCGIHCADDAFEALSLLSAAGVMNEDPLAKDKPYEAELRRLAGRFMDDEAARLKKEKVRAKKKVRER